MKLNEKERIEIYNLYENLEFRLRELKFIVQNPIEISEEEVSNHTLETTKISNDLHEINNMIRDKLIKGKDKYNGD